MGYEEQLMNFEYYILEHYNEYILGLFNIFYAVVLGTSAFLIIWVIIPVVSAICILCICSFLAETYNMIKNTGLLIKNMYNGLVSDVKMIIDGVIVMFTMYYVYSILLNSKGCY